MSRRFWANAFAIFVAVGAIVAVVVYLRANQEIWQLLGNLTAVQVLLLIGVRIIFLGLNGVLLYLIAQKFAVTLSSMEWFSLAYMTALFNYIMPFSGGMLIRATYFKLQHRIAYAQFAAWLAATYFVIFFVTGVVNAVLAWWLATAVPAAWFLVAFFLMMAGGILILLLIPSFRFPANNRLFRLANTALDGWDAIKTDRRLLMRLTLFTLLLFLSNGLSFWLAYRSLGIAVSWGAAFIVSLANIYSAVVSLTPGNIGLQEAMVSLLSQLTGAGIEESLLTILLVRVTTLVSVFTLGPLCTFWLARQLGGNRLFEQNVEA
ncbi:MAG: flippase-like domain-containing protein [Anaerolineae bacterium]|nr:flippase-like domain-containing protein [Anaerolineae bacterium]